MAALLGPGDIFYSQARLIDLTGQLRGPAINVLMLVETLYICRFFLFGEISNVRSNTRKKFKIEKDD